MTGPANATDLQSRSLRALTDAELAVGEVILGDAWGILTTRIRGLAARSAAGYPALDALIIQVQVAMVLRVLSNPLGKLQESQDDYSYRLDSSVSTGALYVSDAEVDLLSDITAAPEGAFTIKPHGWRR